MLERNSFIDLSLYISQHIQNLIIIIADGRVMNFVFWISNSTFFHSFEFRFQHFYTHMCHVSDQWTLQNHLLDVNFPLKFKCFFISYKGNILKCQSEVDDRMRNHTIDDHQLGCAKQTIDKQTIHRQFHQWWW